MQKIKGVERMLKALRELFDMMKRTGREIRMVKEELEKIRKDDLRREQQVLETYAKIAQEVLKEIEEGILSEYPEIYKILDFRRGKVEIRKGKTCLAKVTFFKPTDEELLEMTERLHRFSERIEVRNVASEKGNIYVLVESVQERDAFKFEDTIRQIFSDFLV